ERFNARPASPAVAALARSRAVGLARLRTNFSVDVIDSPELGTPEVVGTKAGTGFLTASAPDRPAAMRSFLAANADAYGLSAAQVANLVLIADYRNPAGNMAWVEFEQRIR